MPASNAPLGPIGLICSSVPSAPEELRKFSEDMDALNKISCLIGSRFKGARINTVAVRLIVQEFEKTLLQKTNGVRGKHSGRPNVRRNGSGQQKPRCKRRSVRSTFRS